MNDLMQSSKLGIMSVLFCLTAAALSVSLFVSCASSNVSQKASEALVGEFDWEEWKSKANWTERSAINYNSDEKKIAELREALKKNPDVSFVLVVSTVCGDCEKEAPKLIKVFRLAGFPINEIKVYGLDEYFTEPSGYTDRFYIPSTPRLFVLKGDEEIGSVGAPDYNWLNGIIDIIMEEQSDDK